MKKNFLPLLFLLSATDISAQLDYSWHMTAGDVTPGNFGNNLRDMETDDSNFVYMAALANGTVDVDNGPGTATISSPGHSTAFIAVYDVNGNYTRSWAIETNNHSEIRNIAIAGNGDVIAVGSCSDTTDFDPSTGVYDAPAEGAFVARYTKYGQLVWAHVIATTWYTYIGLEAVDEENGKICVGGTIKVPQNDSLDIDPGAGVHYEYFTPHCGTGALMTLDANGNYLVSVIPAGSYIYSVCISPFGDMVATGGVTDTIDFNPGPLTYLYIPECYPCPFGDFCVMRYSAAGTYIWHYASGDYFAESAGFDLRLDAAGNVYVAGSGYVDVDPGPFIQNVSTPFVVKYFANGQYAWHKAGGRFDLDANGYAYIYDAMNSNISCYNSAGVGYWSMAYPAMDAYMLRTSPGGNIHMGGSNYGGVDYDPGPGVAMDPAWPNGSSWFVVTLHHLYAGINAAETQQHLNIYPNPVSAHCMLSSDSDEQIPFRITNAIGETVMDGRTEGRNTPVDVTEWLPGLYFIRLEDETRSTMPFVVTH